MPLSDPAAREPIHTRRIEINGYRRADGLFDIEATLDDTKSYPFETRDRGRLVPGDRIHGMAMRMTVDSDYRIHAVEAVMDDTPYGVCPAVAPNFGRLAGLSIARGFLKAASERIGGAQGCTHLRELLAQMATAAFQTIAPLKAKVDDTGLARSLLNTCHAYAEDGDLVRRRWPDLAKR